MLNRFIKSLFNLLGVKVTRTSGGVLFEKPSANRTSQKEQLFPPKISDGDVRQSILVVEERWPNKKPVILVDQDCAPSKWPFSIIRCGLDPLTDVAKFNPQETIFIYACNADDVGLPYIKKIINCSGVFYPVQVYVPSDYSNIDSVAKHVLQSQMAIQLAEGFQKFDFGFGDALNITQAISITASLEGDYVEIGCFRGSSGCVALSYMREIKLKRDCYFLDAFDGFSYDAAKKSSDVVWADTHGMEGEAIVAKRLAAYADSAIGLSVGVIKSNIIEDTLPDVINRIVIANIDVDLYEAVLAGLMKLAPLIVHGGIIIVEDPGHTPALIGSRLALQEFMALPVAANFVPIYLESGQTFLVNKGPAP